MKKVKIRRSFVLIPCEVLHGGSSALVRALDLNQLVFVNQTVRDAHLRVKFEKRWDLGTWSEKNGIVWGKNPKGGEGV